MNHKTKADELIEKIQQLPLNHFVESQHAWGVGAKTELGNAEELQSLVKELLALRKENADLNEIANQLAMDNS